MEFYVNKTLFIVLLAALLSGCSTTSAIRPQKDALNSQSFFSPINLYDENEHSALANDFCKNKNKEEVAKVTTLRDKNKYGEIMRTTFYCGTPEKIQQIEEQQALEREKMKKDRDARVAEEVAAAKRAAALEEKKRVELAKTHPYEAIITCEFGQIIDIRRCFWDKLGGTNLVINSGRDRYQIDSTDIFRYGFHKEDGMHVPLKEKFSVRAQNAGKNFKLRIVVKEMATGKELYNETAETWKVLSVAN